jgi:uncharacterized membrane-anchored protein
LGQTLGFLGLAAVFAAILLAERRLRTASEALYWLAVVTIFTVATELADAMIHALALPVVLGGLAMALAVVQVAEKFRRSRGPDEVATGIPKTNVYYWIALAIAGSMGTVGGDLVAGATGVGLASVLRSAVLAAALSVRTLLGAIGRMPYWGTVVVVRCVGTTAGDYCAGRDGFDWGLPVSTVISAAVLTGLLLALSAPAFRSA